MRANRHLHRLSPVRQAGLMLLGAGLILIGGCAGPTADPPAPAAATAPAAYAPRRDVGVVSAALNRRVDQMLATPAAH